MPTKQTESAPSFLQVYTQVRRDRMKLGADSVCLVGKRYDCFFREDAKYQKYTQME